MQESDQGHQLQSTPLASPSTIQLLCPHCSPLTTVGITLIKSPILKQIRSIT